MKIVLINPPSPFEKEPAMNPPLGLCSISAYAKRNGFENISMIDYSLHEYDYYNDNQYLKEIPLDADIYGITCVTPQYKWLHDISEHVKRKNSGAWIIAGGPHPTNMAKECFEDCRIDFIVGGDGELPFIHILEARKIGIPISGFYSDEKHKVFNDLDKLPFPDRDLIPLMNYNRRIDNNRAIHIVTLRGCYYSCRFCDMSRGAEVRYRSIDNVMLEIDEIIEKYGIKAFVIYDDTFTLNTWRVKDFCTGAKRQKIKWRCFSRSDKITVDLLKIMKESGLVSITFGVESGDDTILENINKCSSISQNKRALFSCREVGVPVRCSLMYGNPGETKETLKNTINFIKETQPNEWNLAVLSPIPGSEFWNHPEKYGIKFDKEALRKNMYMQCNRFGNTGIGEPYISIDSMTDSEFRKNLIWFINELEKVCPRKKIQDTIQNIKFNV